MVIIPDWDRECRRFRAWYPLVAVPFGAPATDDSGIPFKLKPERYGLAESGKSG